MRVNNTSQARYIDRGPSPQETLAANTESEEVQEKLAEHPSVKVRAALAELNQDLFMDVIEMLAVDKSRTVRLALSRNANLPEEAQLMIAEQRK